MDGMKIAVVIPKYGLVGGAEGFAYELTERLAMRSRFEIHLFANQWRQGKAPVIFHKVSMLSSGAPGNKKDSEAYN